MKIIDVICSAGRTGFYFDDQRAIKAGAKSDGAAYVGEPKTPGFTSVRQPGESISVMLVLEDGQIAYGDCAAVQYSGCGGRDPLFLAEDFIPLIEQYIKPALVGREADNFRQLAAMMESIQVDGKAITTTTLDTGVSYIENFAKHFNLPVQKLLRIASEVNPNYDYDFAAEMVDRFELEGKKKFRHLSLSMKTMVSTIICLAVANKSTSMIVPGL